MIKNKMLITCLMVMCLGPSLAFGQDAVPPAPPLEQTPPPPEQAAPEQGGRRPIVNGWFDVGVGAGTPSNEYTFPSSYFAFGMNRALIPEVLEIGVFMSAVKATAKQTVNFEKTGYHETRTYNVTSYGAGLRALLHLTEHWRALAELGACWTTSVLATSVTDAPASPTLSPGDTKESGLDLLYTVGAQYEWSLGSRFSAGLESAYSIRGNGVAQGVKQLQLSGFLKIY